jgi:hypothetical protein
MMADIGIDAQIAAVREAIEDVAAAADDPDRGFTADYLAELRAALRTLEAARAWADDGAPEFDSRGKQYRRLYCAIRGKAHARE